MDTERKQHRARRISKIREAQDSNIHPKKDKSLAVLLLLLILSFFATTGAFFSGSIANWIRNSLGSTTEILRDETRLITLTESNHPIQLVYENDDVRVFIGYDQLLEISGEGENSEFIRQFDDPKNRLLGNNYEHLVAKALEAGKAAVIDRRYQEKIRKIYIRYYEYSCGTLCGEGTRRFYLPSKIIPSWRGNQFLEVMDWIS